MRSKAGGLFSGATMQVMLRRLSATRPRLQGAVRLFNASGIGQAALALGVSALAWAGRAQAKHLRRLQLATLRGRTPGFLFRPLSEAGEASPAQLRLSLEPTPGGAVVRLLKSRGGAREPMELSWPGDHGAA